MNRPHRRDAGGIKDQRSRLRTGVSGYSSMHLARQLSHDRLRLATLFWPEAAAPLKHGPLLMHNAGALLCTATGEQCGVWLKAHGDGLRQVGARVRVHPREDGQEGRVNVWASKGGSLRWCGVGVIQGTVLGVGLGYCYD